MFETISNFQNDVENKYGEVRNLRTININSLSALKKAAKEVSEGKFYEHFINGSKKHIKSNNLSKNGDLYTVSTKGRFLTDGIAAELFLIKLK